MKTLRTVNVKQTTKCSSARCVPRAGILEFPLTASWWGPVLLCAEMIENVMNQRHNLARSQCCRYRKMLRLKQSYSILEISINTFTVPVLYLYLFHLEGYSYNYSYGVLPNNKIYCNSETYLVINIKMHSVNLRSMQKSRNMQYLLQTELCKLRFNVFFSVFWRFC